jgi:hypothetical protein
MGSTAIVFFTRPLKNSFDKMLYNDEPSSSTILEFAYTLLGPLKTFTHLPKVSEKVQVHIISARTLCSAFIDIQFVIWLDRV